ncbi:MAG: hypothetical protein VX681_09160 [Myxococcota bacterium]|nr:hypothetical protein [Myxococcota bacterium]
MIELLAVSPKNRGRGPLSSRVCGAIGIAVVVALAAAGIAHAAEDDVMQGLDEQVQEIKSDVLAIAAELRQLEEKLLYPSDTQVAVFVSLAEGDPLDLDSVRIQIDDQPVAHHIYSFKELGALRKGGVQRIYSGNLQTGDHRIEVSVAGTLPGGTELDRTESFTFRKDVEPRVVGLVLAGQASSDAQIQLGDW